MNRFKIIIIGDDGVGKTNLVSRFIHNKYNDNRQSTIGIEYQSAFLRTEKESEKKLEKESEKKLEKKIDFVDTAGHKRFRSLLLLYFRNSSIVLLVVDSSQRVYEQLEEWLEIYEMYKHLFHPQHVLFIIFNKIDKQPFYPSKNLLSFIKNKTKQEITYQSTSSHTKILSENIYLFDISCKENIGIDFLKKNVLLKHDESVNESILNITNEKSYTSSSC